MITIKESTENDIKFLYDAQSKSCNSFSVLNSVLGYTQTEWVVEKKSDSAVKEYVITDGDQHYVFFRLKPKDSISQSAEFQLHCFDIEKGQLIKITQVLNFFLNQILNYENVTRFFCFLFEHEKTEQKILKEIGMIQEAVYDQHIYVKGHYLDLVVFGTDRMKSDEL